MEVKKFMKQKKYFLLIVLVLIAVMLIGVLAACGGKKVDNTETRETLVVGYSPFSSKFSPFFSKTAYDQDVALMTSVQLLTTDRAGEIVYNAIEGETKAYNGTNYVYKGVADFDVSIDEANKKDTTYTITLKQGVKFSDGQILTADDIIFTYYVLCDPTYTGASTLNATNIKGLKAYLSDEGMDFSADAKAYMDEAFAAAKKYATYYNGVVEANPCTTEEMVYIDWMIENTVETAAFEWTNDYLDYLMDWYGGETLDEAKINAATDELFCYGFEKDTDNAVIYVDAEGNQLEKVYVDAEGNALIREIYETDEGTTLSKFKKVSDGTYLKDDKNNLLGYFDVTVNWVFGDKTPARTYNATTKKYVTAEGVSPLYVTYEDKSKALIFFDDYREDLEALKNIELQKAAAQNGTATITKSISGITKVNEYEVKVVTDGYQATTIYQLGGMVAPLHYYGSDAKYDYANEKYGFEKYDLSSVEAKTTTPMGAGAYKFVSFDKGVVTFERNENYYKGVPKIKYILFKETQDADKVSGVESGTFDITDPSFSNSAVNTVKNANSNGELVGDVITTNTVNNLGYGYIGINANRVKIGSTDADDSSVASKNLRKGFAVLFSVYRYAAIDSYYGDRASVIEYPISNTSWAAPRPSDDGYKAAYSLKVDGTPIYATDDSDQVKKTKALAAAKEYFEAAGYTFDEEAGTATAPAGGKIEFTAHIPGDGTGDHPSFAILTGVHKALASIGIKMQITDYANSDNFWPVLEGNEADIWAAAWDATVDPDMYQVYHSSNNNLAGNGKSNSYNIRDNSLDADIITARESDDQATRKATYVRCLNTIMSWGVEVPTYQRQNAIIFSTQRVKVDTVTPDITTFWTWMNDIELLEMK